MKTATISTTKRWSLLSWMLVPLLIVWLATNYLIGQLNQPNWKPAGSESVGNVSQAFSIPDYHWHGEALLTLWFDDGWSTQYSQAFLLLEKYNLTAALAVPTRLIGYPDYMSWAQVKKLQANGWEITAHTRNHDCAMDTADFSHQREEIVGGLEDLQIQNIFAPNYVSPCGIVNESMLQLVKENFNSYRTSGSGVNPLPVADKYNLLVRTIEVSTTVGDVHTWIKEAQDSSSWLIIVFHQIDDKKGEFSTTPQLYTQMVQAVLDSEIQVVLPSQALGLTDERVKK
jgi:peptidoglycan/xylan/chitin deacetylase (PgdA/CDA1 family)